ncbi:MAG: hypothetical protein ACLQDV_30785 [Candidatus Binataceae bacterium]
MEIYLLYLPVSGVVQNLLYPAPWPVLIKDLAFLLPAYIGFCLSGETKQALAGLPKSILGLVSLYAAIVIVQTFNPSGPPLIQRLIGLKVSLFYLPVLLMGWCYVRDERSLLRLSRILICLIWLPCLTGIAQWLLSLKYGYVYTMTAFYGEAGAAVTQSYVTFENGMMRIPATFSFSTQYMSYLLCMFVPLLGCSELEIDPFWRRARSLSYWLVCVAAFMTGNRVAFLVVPGILVLFYVLRRGMTGMLAGIIISTVAIVGMLQLTGVDPRGLFDMERTLTTEYVQSSIVDEMVEAMETSVMGRGVGSNTGAARVAVEGQDLVHSFENFYAKTEVELGILGLIVLTALLVLLFVFALRMQFATAGFSVQPYCSAVAALFAALIVYSLKGYVLDLDPLNVLYWLYAGAMLEMPAVVISMLRENQGADEWHMRPEVELVAAPGADQWPTRASSTL